MNTCIKMPKWIQEPKGKDKEIIEKYYCGVKIIMNDGKRITERFFVFRKKDNLK